MSISLTAPLVREIFERYASGETVADITKDLNARQIKTSIGKDFNKNSLHRLLRNRRCIGYYIDRAVLECRKLLTDCNIEKIAAAVAACEADYDSSAIRRTKVAIQEADTAIENLERGQSVEMITERIEKRKKEKDALQGQLAIEMGKQVTFTAPQISAFLYSLKRGGVNDENSRRGLINIFFRAVYLWDDRMTLILNGGDRPVSLDGVRLDEIEGHFEDAVLDRAACSPLVWKRVGVLNSFLRLSNTPTGVLWEKALIFQAFSLFTFGSPTDIIKMQTAKDFLVCLYAWFASTCRME